MSNHEAKFYTFNNEVEFIYYPDMEEKSWSQRKAYTITMAKGGTVRLYHIHNGFEGDESFLEIAGEELKCKGCGEKISIPEKVLRMHIKLVFF